MVLITAFSADGPVCLQPSPSSGIQFTINASGITDEDLLARLVYAETESTGFPDDPVLHEAIAWGIMNRVRLGEASPSMQKTYGRGIRGVVFRKDQFNPAVSSKSPFSRQFLCPRDALRWKMARDAVRKALRGEDNPFIETSWEKRHGLSLVVNFYYPKSIQARGPLAPWEASKSLLFIGDVRIGEGLLSSERVRFYRLKRPPGDIYNGE